MSAEKIVLHGMVPQHLKVRQTRILLDSLEVMTDIGFHDFEVGDFTGPPPYFGNPKVYAEIYDLRTGALKETGAKIPVPGTYKTWRMIDAPGWWVQPVT